MNKTLSFLLLLFVSRTYAGNFATCLLDELPGVQGDAAAFAIRKVCSDKYPGGFLTIDPGSGRGWFSYGSGAECTAKLAAKTVSRSAGSLIANACNWLYNEPEPWNAFNKFDKQPKLDVPIEQPKPSRQDTKPDTTPAVVEQPTARSSSPYPSKQQPYQQRPECVIKPVMNDEEMARCRKR